MHTQPNAPASEKNLHVNLKIKSKKTNAGTSKHRHLKSAPLDLSIQFSSSLKPKTLGLFKAIFTKKNINKWIAWTLNPQTTYLTEVTIRIVDQAEGQALNQQFRGRAYATNILTFNSSEHFNSQADLLICAPVVQAEARSMGISLLEHCAHLTVHGALHAQGYDHEAGPKEALEMESLESFLMLSLGFRDPYLEH